MTALARNSFSKIWYAKKRSYLSLSFLDSKGGSVVVSNWEHYWWFIVWAQMQFILGDFWDYFVNAYHRVHHWSKHFYLAQAHVNGSHRTQVLKCHSIESCQLSDAAQLCGSVCHGMHQMDSSSKSQDDLLEKNGDMEIFLACIRIKSHATDVILSLNKPMASRDQQIYNGDEVITKMIESFVIKDYGLFGSWVCFCVVYSCMHVFKILDREKNEI